MKVVHATSRHPVIGSLPPLIMTSDPDSFAWRTFKYRIPAIVEEVIALNAFPDDINRDLQALKQEIIEGRIRGLREAAPDVGFWVEVSRPYIGRSWLEVPWYWAEAFFYRRVLEATRYFQPGPWHLFDPYATKKQAEWRPDAAPALAAKALEHLPAEGFARFEALLHHSLWGNRVDLSYNVAGDLARLSRPEEDKANLLIDDTPRIWEYLTQQARHTLVLITDNAGTELLMDLALVDFLIGHQLVQQVIMHLKPQPFFVSDAMISDVRAALEALRHGDARTAALRVRLVDYLHTGRLVLTTHRFYASSLFYFEMPDDLRAQLAAADFVLLKGDVNYRRILGDAHWPVDTPFQRITAYFPAPFANLRTLKGELIVGISEELARRLSQLESDWMVNGRRGLIQARL
ncbi:MAG: damage-control phosphatase ARMT1 family protein [Anaerolineae bacterium]|nr:damage-control phosphatase ARMT1 family protein [Anaerolineae bacterium]MDW8071119.1 damage-control phosphatase ARMT1 family protein [Anaerolineae bacterium]